jgi:DNA-binding winged helix-turn-helix (wHTH) protein/Flp pilus assembly protein TadD
VPGGSRYSFDAFELDSQTRRLTRDGEPVVLPDRHVDVLLQLVSSPGVVLSKDALVEAAWRDVAVTDNSLEQAISALRKSLGGQGYIETVPRRGYRFTASVTRTATRESDAALDELLAPHRAWIEGRAAIESLERDQILRARAAFERVLSSVPDQPVGHIGLANACVLQFEMTRADHTRDTEALARAAHHAREACRFDPRSAEAWATLGFVLDRTGNHVDAVAATRRAVTLEPDNWRHYFRQAFVSWGEERLRAARRALALFPGFPLAHWLAATVLVARQVLDEAERELLAGASVQDEQAAHSPFSAVALHWLLGLVYLARGDEERAVAEFHRELSFEGGGHLYARECCANTWYAIGAVHLRRGRASDARAAFQQALTRVPAHPLAAIGLRYVAAEPATIASDPSIPKTGSPDAVVNIDVALCQAAHLSLAGARADAARLVDGALAAAPAGSAGWALPVEPLLNVGGHPAIWAPALTRLRTRAA